jgi:hypothetical protein
MAMAPQLEKRLGELRTSRTRVELDIPQLAFINEAGHGRWRGCSLRRAPARVEFFAVTTVQRLFELVDLRSLGRGGRTHPGNCAPTSPLGLVAREDPGRRATPGRPTGR